MAIWIKWTEKQEQMWADWVAARPASIQEMVAKYNLRMDRLYRLKTTGQRVTLYSLSEEGTVTVNVLGKFNSHLLGALLPDKAVFGIKPADLEECEWEGEVENGAPYENL
jgi:hypothetical protein